MTDESGVYIYADLFGGRNILSDVGGYWYIAIFIDETTRIKFPMTIKLKIGYMRKSR